jgi:small subunit ribosomal protein S8
MTFISNIITIIRNGYATRSEYIIYKVSHTSIPVKLFEVLHIMRKIGMIRAFEYIESNSITQIKSSCIIYLKYDSAGVSVIDTVFLISKPSRRVYLSAAALWQPQSTVGFLVLSTTQGILTINEARRLNVGCEVLFGIT